MIKLNSRIGSESQKIDFIRECEEKFEARLDEVCAEVVRDGVKIIALSGPTCSGKTTTAAKLTAALTANGADVHLVSIDNFFRERDVLDREAIMQEKSIDYDSVNAIDLKLLAERTASIIAGDPTDLPIYDFTLGRCTHYETVDPDEHSVFIFEGIQAIYPEVTALFGDNYKSIYICIENDLEVGDSYFFKRELRLLRRLVRDYKFRGAAPEFTFYLWRSVAANEDRSILPYADSVDLKINSFMGYEIYLMKQVLPEILSLVPEDNPYFPKAYDICRKLEGLDSISPELIPKDSLLREFIG